MPNMLKCCHVLSIASIFYFCQSSQFKFLIYIPFYTLWNVCLVYVTSKWTEKNYSREGHQWFGNPDIKSRHTNDQISPRFVIFSLQKRILSSCPSRFHFGQVHIVWWLSYCQVGKKISVEPCIIGYGIKLLIHSQNSTMDKYFRATLNWLCDYSSMLELKCNHAIKMGYWIWISHSTSHTIWSRLCCVLFCLFQIINAPRRDNTRGSWCQQHTPIHDYSRL